MALIPQDRAKRLHRVSLIVGNEDVQRLAHVVSKLAGRAMQNYRRSALQSAGRQCQPGKSQAFYAASPIIDMQTRSPVAAQFKNLNVWYGRLAYRARPEKRRAVTERESEGSNPAASSTAARRALRVLIADDDRDSAVALQAMLRGEGDEVAAVMRGEELLEVSRLLRPDAVIVDLNMPGMSGYAAARELRERHGGQGPFLIALSRVWTRSSEKLLGIAAGFDEYLAKPCDPLEIVRLLEPLRARAAASLAGASRASSR
jgi:CheY-like chemotaxis protein